jgi:pyrroline-5-carboxylate reductase
MFAGKRIGFIGGGAIAEALIRGVVNAGLLTAGQITVGDVAAERLAYLSEKYGVATSLDTAAVAAQADVLFLTVKPQVIAAALDTVAPAVASKTLVISVAAGVTLAALEERLPQVPVVRVMPNTPVAVGAGMSAIALGRHATARDGEAAMAIFSAVGRAVMVNEDAMDAVTGLSGSGPSFAYVLIDALAMPGSGSGGVPPPDGDHAGRPDAVRGGEDGAGDGRTPGEAARYGDVAGGHVDRRGARAGAEGRAGRVDGRCGGGGGALARDGAEA